MRKIDLLLFDNVNLLDVAGPAQAFSSAYDNGSALYETRFVSLDGNPVTACCGLRLGADATVSLNSDASDLLIPGGDGIDVAMQNDGLMQVLKQWTDRPDRRLISVCSGALILANSGTLNNRRATTHWSRRTQAQQQFPDVNWAIDQLYVSDGNIHSSAGVSTGIDLSLAIIQNDHGGECALSVARELVVYMQRPGTQSQFAGIVDLQMRSNDAMSLLVNAVTEHPTRSWSVKHMAEFCNMTERTLTRRFRTQLQTSPKRFVEKTRVAKACELISAGLPLASVLSRCGLSDQQQMQRAFKRQLGTSVDHYVKRFTPTAP